MGAQAADLPTTKPTEAPAPASRPCFDSLWDYMDSTPSECPLTWKGITLFGVIDAGYGYSSHGANFNGAYPQGVAELIAKNSQGYKWQFVPSGLQRSSIGLDAKEEFAPGWSFVGRVTATYDPYSLQFSNGPKSLVENNNLTIGNQSANSDSSRAGQFDNSQGYVGVSNTTYGTLTVGRQNAFSDEIQYRYDPNGGDYAFSLIGNSSTYLNGVGDTETARYNSVVKYTVAYNNFHAGALWQFGGYELGNGSDGAFQFDGGGDYRRLLVRRDLQLRERRGCALHLQRGSSSQGRQPGRLEGDARRYQRRDIGRQVHLPPGDALQRLRICRFHAAELQLPGRLWIVGRLQRAARRGQLDGLHRQQALAGRMDRREICGSQRSRHIRRLLYRPSKRLSASGCEIHGLWAQHRSRGAGRRVRKVRSIPIARATCRRSPSSSTTARSSASTCTAA